MARRATGCMASRGGGRWVCYQIGDVLALRFYRQGGAGSRQLQDLHCAAGNWLYGEQGWQALGRVCSYYACGLNVDGLHSGERSPALMLDHRTSAAQSDEGQILVFRMRSTLACICMPNILSCYLPLPDLQSCLKGKCHIFCSAGGRL